MPRMQLEALQQIVAELGSVTYPLFLRLGGSPTTTLQPVVARVLLKEIEKFTAALADQLIAGVRFFDDEGVELGGLYRSEMGASDTVRLEVTSEGISVVLSQFPPPVGFRSRPGLKAGQYECLFERITYNGKEYLGSRTAAMGGSGAAVPLPSLPLLPVTKWDFARVSGKPAVWSIVWVRTPAPDAYRDVVHVLSSACDESLRLKAPLKFQRD